MGPNQRQGEIIPTLAIGEKEWSSVVRVADSDTEEDDTEEEANGHTVEEVEAMGRFFLRKIFFTRMGQSPGAMLLFTGAVRMCNKYLGLVVYA